MGKIWEFFDNLNEVVYVSDMDTHELIYMNKKTLELYDLHSVEELAGKKCYELLQNSNVTCAFCNNRELEEGSFAEWQVYNPIVGKYFILKDTMIMDGDRRCRLEIAIDNSVQHQKDRMYEEHQNQETLANEGMRLALQADTPDQSINIILEYLGKALHGERTYIFEKNASGGDDNTYEWVANGVTPEIDNLQNLPPEICANWYREFSENKNIIINDLEDIRESDPLQYENLKRQDIHSLVVIPLYNNNENFGFYGVDNPGGESLELTQNMLQIVGHFIVSCLKRRNLRLQLQNMSFSDQLTSLGNRFAMEKYLSEHTKDGALGVVYCDITGLKRVNDSEGHKAGDRLILRACESLREVFSGYGLFRVGGDELLALCPQIDRKDLEEKSQNLKRVALEHDVVLAVGAVWQETNDGDIDKILTQAERLMYEDKSLYYRTKGIDRRK
ncbi:MAG: diguanylate cyclase domain-containing protein [Lachnospiraceae bacterium]